MADILIISTSVIQAASQKDITQSIDLTPWDLQLLPFGPIQKGLLFHKPKPPQNKDSQSTLIQHLKTSLSRTLNFFAPLAGRLAMIEHDDNTTSSFFIDCNNAGAEFVHAIAHGVSIADIIEPIYVPSIVHSFFPLNGVKNYEGISKPLLAVQVIELVDGIFIGCTINHTAADGTSFWNFFNSWAEISRGFDHISKPPVFQRGFLDGIKFPIRIPFSFDKYQFVKFTTPPLKERVFHFTKENIATLKVKANAKVGTNKISSLQALLAHLWRSVIRSQDLDPDQETHFLILVGARSRLHQLPEQYFGNTVQQGTVTLKAREILENGIGYVAWEMNKMIALHTEEKLRDCLKSWAENPELLTLGSLTTNSVPVSSSPRFNVYSNDFGWGRPIAVRSGEANKYVAKITLFQGVEEGSVDIEACFSPETLQAMGNDTEFMVMDAVTIKCQ